MSQEDESAGQSLDISESEHARSVAKRLGGPKPPESVLARFIGDSPEAATELPPEVVLARQRARRAAIMRRARGGLSGAKALLDALRKKAK